MYPYDEQMVIPRITWRTPGHNRRGGSELSSRMVNGNQQGDKGAIGCREC